MWNGFVAPTVACRQKQHRHFPARATPLLQYADAIHHRQPDIEYHRIIGFGVTQMVSVLAVMSGIDGIAGIFQSRLQLAVQVLVIFDNQDAHGRAAPAFNRLAILAFRHDQFHTLCALAVLGGHHDDDPADRSSIAHGIIGARQSAAELGSLLFAYGVAIRTLHEFGLRCVANRRGCDHCGGDQFKRAHLALQ
jgi:hypothetical protein